MFVQDHHSLLAYHLDLATIQLYFENLRLDNNYDLLLCLTSNFQSHLQTC